MGYNDSLSIREQLVSLTSFSPEAQRDLALNMNKLGDLHKALGEVEAAHVKYLDSFMIRENLSATDPSNTQWQRDRIISLVNLAELGDASAQRYAKAVEIIELLHAEGRLHESDAWMIDDLKNRLCNIH